MRSRRLLKLCTFFAVTGIGVILGTSPAAADSFNQNRLIDDSVFNNVGTMNAGQIDGFLNQFASSCISTNNGFSAPDPTGYSPSGGYTYGGNVSAGQVIYDAAHAYDINPQVLLTTLQKEQSLVSGGGGCSTLRYAAAAGYGCPDSGGTYSYSNVNLYTIRGNTVTSVSGTCVNSSLKVGFSQQLIRAAWLLKFGQQRSLGNTGWAIIRGSWDNSDDLYSCYSGPMTQGYRKTCPSNSQAVYYDGYKTIDNTAVHMDTGATAALYWYTPHFHGNQVFVSTFTTWFGPTYSDANNYHAQFTGMSGYPTVQAGNSTAVWITYKNVGSLTWYDCAGRPAGTTTCITYAATNPVNRASNFYDSSTWYNPYRPNINFAAVYESDGTTLAADQHTAVPGQIVRFAFNVSAPRDTAAGTYREAFEPVVEWSPNWGMQGWGYFDITVTPPPHRLAPVGSSDPNVTMRRGDGTHAWVSYRNTGTQPLYDGSQGTANPTVLATTDPINRTSNFYASDWHSVNRPVINFTHVYESDGVTLAANQHVAQPGQIMRFDFTLQSPGTQAPNTYTETFQPVLEGASDWNASPYTSFTLALTAPVLGAHYVSMSGYPTITKGSSASAWIEYQNVGTQTWYDCAGRPAGVNSCTTYATTSNINRTSNFYSNTWHSSNRPAIDFAAVYESDGTTLAANQHMATPGQIVKYAFSLSVPSNTASGTYQEPFEPVQEFAQSWVMGGWGYFMITVP